LLPDAHQHLQVRAQTGTRGLSRDEQPLAEWAFWHGSEVGQGGLTRPRLRGAPPGTAAAFVPLRAGGRTLGVLGVADQGDRRPLSAAERTVLGTFADQTAVALERLTLLHEAERAEVLARTDELKSALMSAVSHDLRTPLASIIASVTSLLEPGMQWDEETREDFLQGIYEEAQRLNRLVSNLLDMSRIEGGALHPQKDWYGVDEVIRAVLERLASRLASYSVTTDVAPDLPLVLLDFTEIDQVLTNLVENALKYTRPGTPICIAARRRGADIEVSVTDSGPGVPPRHLARLFDKFYRGESGTTAGFRPQGMGLGLAICKGLIEAHGGRIAARNVPEGGLQITFTLPIPPAAGTVAAPVLAHAAS
jgi:two-component system sensor histidine kinase KdpD